MMIGRRAEHEELRNRIDSEKSEFVAVYGRRRVGKTFLIREACHYQFAFEHTGIKNITFDNGKRCDIPNAMRRQLKEFAVSLRRYGRMRKSMPHDWFEAFHLLEDLLDTQGAGRKVVFLDECPWMDTPRSDFLAALDHFWNGWCTMRRDIVLIVCGSAASWFADRLDDNTGGLHNRLTRHIYLRPFTLGECEELIRVKGVVMNRMQILECYMIFGGIPYYWDLLHRELGFVQNVDALLFAPNAELRDEYRHLYLSLFRHPEPYMDVIRALNRRKCGLRRDEITVETGLPKNGKLTEILSVLERCDFIHAYTMPGRRKNEYLYQLVDNFSLFHFRFLDTQTGRSGAFWSTFATTSDFRVWRGLAFERVALQHVPQIKRKLGISGVITHEYAWRYAAEGDQDTGGQVDLVIERADNVVNLCEIKCTAEPFEIDDAYDHKLLGRRERFCAETGTRSAVHLTMISASGIKRNANANDVQSFVDLDDLFATA